MSFNQKDYDALQSAINKGVKSAQRGEEKIEYRSLEEMRSILRSMDRSRHPKRRQKTLRIGRFTTSRS